MFLWKFVDERLQSCGVLSFSYKLGPDATFLCTPLESLHSFGGSSIRIVKGSSPIGQLAKSFLAREITNELVIWRL